MAVEMQISRIALDPLTNMPIVILAERDGERRLPIWIGLLEASAIASRLEGVEVGRPMTHDLLCSVIDSLDGKVERITVVNLENNTYFAVVRLVADGRVSELDSRPSDALALALRVEVPIFVEEHVLDQAARMDEDATATPAEPEEEPAAPSAPAAPEDKDKLAEFLENLPADGTRPRRERCIVHWDRRERSGNP